MTEAAADAPGTVSIGQLAREAGVSSRTIRYYEELGIIPEPRRSRGGTRKYPREYQSYLDAALTLKDLGFRLEDIKPLARLMLGKSVSAAQREKAAQLLERRCRALDEQVAALQRIREGITAAS